MRRHSQFIAVIAVASMAAIVGLAYWFARHGPTESITPAGSPVSREQPPAEGSRTRLESVNEESVATSRSEEVPPSAPEVKPAARDVETEKSRDSRLRAKMMEFARLEEWDKKYAPFVPEQLEKERNEIEKAIREATRVEFDRRFASREYEVLAKDGVYRGSTYNNCVVMNVQIRNGLVLKATLPEAGYEEIYKQKALSTWLSEQANERAVVK